MCDWVACGLVLAQTVWGYICSGCQYSQPSAHHNQSYDPNIVFNLPSSEDETPFLNMCDALLQPLSWGQ
jgi:hypothetical protein